MDLFYIIPIEDGMVAPYRSVTQENEVGSPVIGQLRKVCKCIHDHVDPHVTGNDSFDDCGIFRPVTMCPGAELKDK